MDLDNMQRKYGLPAPLPVVQNGKFATRFPLNLEHRGDDVFQFGGKYIGEIENIYDLLYKILTNQEIDASLALPYAIKITEDKLYIRDKTNSEWILIFDITKPNFPKEIELYELIYKAITHQVIGEDTSYPGQFKIEENILYVRDKDNLIWTQIGDVTKEFLGATEATQAILEQINEILIEVQKLKTELNRQIATTNETLTTALKAANEAMTSAQSINIRTFNSVEEMKASNTLKTGALAKTLGFYTAGDGGGADYLITDNIDEDEADEASIITLQNDLYAKLLIKDFINVKQWGVYGDGVNDDTRAIQNCIDKNAKTIIYFSNGTYGISASLIVDKNNDKAVLLDLQNAKILALGSFPTDTYMINIGGKGDTGSGYRNTKYLNGIKNGVVDGNGVADKGLLIQGTHLSTVTDISITGINKKGMQIDVANDNSSSDGYVDRVIIWGTEQENSVALEITGSDNKISHVRTGGFTTGIKITGGGNFLFRCHPLGWLANIAGTIGFNITGENTYLTECYSDGFNTALQFGANTINVKDFFALFNGVNDSESVLFNNTGSVYKSIIDNVYADFGSSITANKSVYKGTFSYWVGTNMGALLNNLRVKGSNDSIYTIPIASFSTFPNNIYYASNLNAILAKGTYGISQLPAGVGDIGGKSGILIVTGTPYIDGIMSGFIKQTITVMDTKTNRIFSRIGKYSTINATDLTWTEWKEL